MKRCPTCNRAFDDAQQFCLEDGTPLVDEEATFDSQKTMVGPPPNYSSQQPTQRVVPQETSQFQQQQSFQNPQPFQNPQWSPGPQFGQPETGKKSAVPWVLGGLVAVVLVLILVVGGVAYFAYRSPATANTNANGNTNGGANTNSNSGGPSNSNSPGSNSNSGGTGTSAPTDEETVLQQLTELENQWNEANVKGDKEALERILADEYIGTTGEGSVEKKEEYISKLEPNPEIKSQTLGKLAVTLKGNTAALTGINTVRLKDGSTEQYRFVDTYTWRDGRWQAISAQSVQVK
ncbi:MAG TPA: nuclear transport factor 2 family protein [Pyrinomonadaceae bacterium]|jgi:hypothetical protein